MGRPSLAGNKRVAPVEDKSGLERAQSDRRLRLGRREATAWTVSVLSSQRWNTSSLLLLEAPQSPSAQLQGSGCAAVIQRQALGCPGLGLQHRRKYWGPWKALWSRWTLGLLVWQQSHLLLVLSEFLNIMMSGATPWKAGQ